MSNANPVVEIVHKCYLGKGKKYTMDEERHKCGRPIKFRNVSNALRLIGKIVF